MNPINIDFTPRYNRRANWHDYRSRCIYMITITKSDGAPYFSQIDGNPFHPIVTMTEIGKAINQELSILCSKYQELKIYSSVIMPDHLHFVLDVTKPTEYHLGTAVGDLKGACSRRFWQLSNKTKISLFKENFHDRILMKKGQLAVMKKYVGDNPRRYLIKKNNPHLFNRQSQLEINGEIYDCLGNIFLLRAVLIEQVRVSRSYSQSQMDVLDLKWKRAISEGGVLISPFISPKEKAYRNLAIENGGNVIIIEENGMGDRYKPSGKYFDLCSEGRLLIIAPTECRLQRQDMSRKKALELNDLAAKIAAGDFSVKLKSHSH